MAFMWISFDDTTRTLDEYVEVWLGNSETEEVVKGERGNYYDYVNDCRVDCFIVNGDRVPITDYTHWAEIEIPEPPEK